MSPDLSRLWDAGPLPGEAASLVTSAGVDDDPEAAATQRTFAALGLLLDGAPPAELGGPPTAVDGRALAEVVRAWGDGDDAALANFVPGGARAAQVEAYRRIARVELALGRRRVGPAERLLAAAPPAWAANTPPPTAALLAASRATVRIAALRIEADETPSAGKARRLADALMDHARFASELGVPADAAAARLGAGVVLLASGSDAEAGGVLEKLAGDDGAGALSSAAAAVLAGLLPEDRAAAVLMAAAQRSLGRGDLPGYGVAVAGLARQAEHCGDEAGAVLLLTTGAAKADEWRPGSGDALRGRRADLAARLGEERYAQACEDARALAAAGL